MGQFRTKTVALAVVMAGAAATASGSVADYIFRVEASNQSGSGFLEFGLEVAQEANGVTSWSVAPGANMEIRDTNTDALVAILDSCGMTYVDDPVIALTFGVIAGTSDTAFSITSGSLVFPTIGSVTGRATGSLNVTDTDGDGASATGAFGGKAWSARYNGGSFAAGTVFADLVDPVSFADPYSSDSNIDEFGPAGSFVGIAGTLDDTALGVAFTLTANDLASGNGLFVVLPTPGTVMLFAGGGLIAAARRRR